MSTSKDKAAAADKAPADTPDELAGAELAAEVKRPEDLTTEERAQLSRHYRSLRLAESPGDAEEARERIRGLLGAEAEIGDHVLVLADGRRVRTEYAGATSHDGMPVVGAYESVL